MVRKLAAAMLGVGVLIPGLANALGLGEIKLNSALSEPLDAEIELVQVRELTSNEILPSLAAHEDFAAANVERYHFLTDLKFEVITNAQGKSVIKVRSRKPVKEPFLNFLVEVNWPAGRLLREYTLFLDPPTYSAQPAAPVSAPTATSSTSSGSTQPVTTSYQPATAPQTTYSSGGDYAQGSAGDYTIGSNDSLWSIARSMKPSDRVSIQQTMLAIQRKNPDAFIDGNINLLKKGAVLRAPTEAEVLELDNRDAMAIAAEQNRQWRERAGVSEPEARQIDLSGRSVTREQDPAPEADTDRLKLVSAGTSGDSGQGGSAEAGELRNQLSVAEENIDKFKLENEDLRLRLSDLEDQLDTSEKVLTLKDEQIAALQAKLRELEAAEQAAAQQPQVAEEPAEVMPEEGLAEEPEVMPEEDMTGELVAPETGEEVDYNFTEEVSTEEGVEEPLVEEPEPMAPGDDTVAGEPADMSEEMAEPVAEEPVPAPAVQPQSVSQEQDLVSQILGNPLYLAAGGGAILLLIVVGLLAARRKQAGNEFEEEIPEEFDLPESQGEDGLMELDSVNLEEDDAFEEAVEASAEEETVPQTADVIGEADIYIAYGRFPQAIEMLEKAAQSEPDRADIRLKLCEVCAEANEPEVFMNHYRVLQDVGSVADVSKADTLREKLGGISEVAPDEASSDDFGGDETLLAEPAGDDFDFDSLEPASSDESSLESELEQESDTGLDFDLGDLEDTGASFTSESESTEAPIEQKSGEVAGLDFDLNLNLDEEQTEEESSSLDFDLDSSFGSEEISTPEETSKDESDEVSLDFDTDFSLDEVPSSEPTQEASLDFEAPSSLDEPEKTEDLSEDNAMDFDLDFDSSTTELDETPTMDFTEAGSELDTSSDESTSDEEPLLDSQTAAQLADELDLDLDGDFLDAPSLDTEEPSLDEPSFEPVAEEPAQEEAPEEDQTIIASVPPAVAPSTPAANDMSDSGDELDFLSDADEASTKLDLARAYIDMGDRDGAKDILDEVMIEGNDNQKTEAKELLTRLES